MDKETIDSIITYSLSHPIQSVCALVILYWAIHYGIKLKREAKKNGNNHNCQCNQILPQITQINDRLINQDQKIDNIVNKFDTLSNKVYEIQGQVKFLYTKFNNK